MASKNDRFLPYWLALAQLPFFIQKEIFNELRENADLPAIFLRYSEENNGLPTNIMTFFRSLRLEKYERVIDWSYKRDIVLLTLADSQYPELLKQIPDPPPVLFVRGNVSSLSDPQIALVGTRKPTPVGETSAMRFASELSEAGLTVTSGLAIGVDSGAHRGALASGGNTVAVAGTGFDRVYPREHAMLSEAIAAQGAVVTEFFPNAPLFPQNFPRRNRIISGLSLGVLVIEAAIRSGSLITARCATEQGREVFALPGSIYNIQSSGCHSLIRQGATLVEMVEDILSELKSFSSPRERPQTAPKTQSTFSKLAPESIKLVECVGFEPTSFEFILEKIGSSPAVLTANLLALELSGLIRSVQGGYIREEPTRRCTPHEKPRDRRVAR